jgi:uncharacterized peroxidase-related enzyme
MPARESFFPVPDETDLPGNLQSLFAKAREKLGFVPNVFRSYAYRPDRFSAWFAHYAPLHEPSENLSTADREMIAVVVSHVNRCTYCLVSHGHDLRVALDDVVTADHIAFNWRTADLDDRQRAICAYVDKLTATPAEMTRGDLDGLAAVGLSKEEVWDVVELASMYAFTNRMALATGMEPNREYHLLSRGQD